MSIWKSQMLFIVRPLTAERFMVRDHWRCWILLVHVLPVLELCLIHHSACLMWCTHLMGLLPRASICGHLTPLLQISSLMFTLISGGIYQLLIPMYSICRMEIIEVFPEILMELSQRDVKLERAGWHNRIILVRAFQMALEVTLLVDHILFHMNHLYQATSGVSLLGVWIGGKSLLTDHRLNTQFQWHLEVLAFGDQDKMTTQEWKLQLLVVRLVYTNPRVICGQKCALKERTATQFMVVYMYLSVPLQL